MFLSGLLVSAMAVLGSIFLGVWIVGVVYGAKGDAAAAANARAEAEWARQQAEQRAPQRRDGPAEPQG